MLIASTFSSLQASSAGLSKPSGAQGHHAKPAVATQHRQQGLAYPKSAPERSPAWPCIRPYLPQAIPDQPSCPCHYQSAFNIGSSGSTSNGSSSSGGPALGKTQSRAVSQPLAASIRPRCVDSEGCSRSREGQGVDDMAQRGELGPMHLHGGSWSLHSLQLRSRSSLHPAGRSHTALSA